jgi:signal transduction histidine kinase
MVKRSSNGAETGTEYAFGLRGTRRAAKSHASLKKEMLEMARVVRFFASKRPMSSDRRPKKGLFSFPSYVRGSIIYVAFSVLYASLYSRLILVPASGTGRTVGLADIRSFVYIFVSAVILFVILRTTELSRIKNEERERLRMVQMAQADKLITLGTLVSGVAHEINNPVNFITLNLPLIREFWQGAKPILDAELAGGGDFYLGRLKYSVFRERLDGMFEGIFEGTERVRGIVATLKEFARPDPSDMSQAVDPNDALAGAVRLLSSPIARATERFTLDLAPSIPSIKGSSQKLGQIAINLIQNALEALPSRDAAVSVSSRYDQRSGRVLIEVADEGSGIDPELLPRITDPFFTTKRGSGGMGLGLAIVSQIVHDHGGTIDFDSKPGHGTRVLLSFPAQPEGRG